MMSSIREYGIKTPIKITKDFIIIGGHRRHGIALELRLESVPCQIARYELTDDQLKLHTIEDNYLQRQHDKKSLRQNLYSDLVDLVTKQLPNWEYLIRENKAGLQEKLEEMGFSAAVATKIVSQERRKASKIDNSRRKGIIQTDYDSMIKNVNRLVSVYENTNSDTQEKTKNILIKKLEVIK